MTGGALLLAQASGDGPRQSKTRDCGEVRSTSRAP